MSGYLASIVQRGAGIAQPAAVAAPITPAPSSPGFSHALEAAPQESIAVQPALPVVPALPPTAHDAGVGPGAIYSNPVHPEAAPRAVELPRESVEPRAEGVSPTLHETRVMRSVESSVIRTDVVQVAAPAAAIAAPAPAASRNDNRVASAATHLADASAESSVSPAAPFMASVDSPALLPAAARDVAVADALEKSPSQTPAIVEVTLEPASQPRMEIAPRAAAPPATAPEALPIHVRIGKIEVKPPAPATPAAPATPRPGAALGFDRYQRLRTYRS